MKTGLVPTKVIGCTYIHDVMEDIHKVCACTYLHTPVSAGTQYAPIYSSGYYLDTTWILHTKMLYIRILLGYFQDIQDTIEIHLVYYWDATETKLE